MEIVPLILLLVSLLGHVRTMKDGLNADPEDCSKYYHCSNNHCYHQSCPGGLYWNPLGLYCDYAIPAGCSMPGDSSSSTTSSTTSTIPPYTGNTTDRLPKHILALYLLLSDDTTRFNAEYDWRPQLHDYQIRGANVFILTFINPANMKVPIAFRNLAATKGTSAPGAVPSNSKVLFSIGGEGYSLSYNPWDWLTTPEKAKEMGARVAKWEKEYNCDGIDLDIEAGAGDHPAAGENLLHFTRAVRANTSPSFIIIVPVFGWPQVTGVNQLVSTAYGDGNQLEQLDGVGIMVYQGAESLNWVYQYTEATSRGNGAITSNVPANAVILGVSGKAPASIVNQLVDAVIKEEYLGIMVWLASVHPQLAYGDDATSSKVTQDAFISAMNRFQSV